MPALERDNTEAWRLGAGADHTVECAAYVRLAPGETLYGQWAFVGAAPRTGQPIVFGEYAFDEVIGPTIRVWSTADPGPTEPSQYAGGDVPPVPGDGKTGRCHEADSQTPVCLRPATEAGLLPLETEFTLVNYGTKPIEACSFEWTLYKLHADAWHKIEPSKPKPQSNVCVLQPVSAGSTREKTLQLFNRDRFDSAGDDWCISRLGPGTYAYCVRGSLNGDKRAFGAVFELAGGPVTVTPDPNIAVDREGTTVRATGPAVDPGHQGIPVERVSAAPDGEVLLPEQLFHPTLAALRNAVGLLEPGVDAVSVEYNPAIVSFERPVADYVSSEGKSVLFVSAGGPVPLRITAESHLE